LVPLTSALIKLDTPKGAYMAFKDLAMKTWHEPADLGCPFNDRYRG
jgi:hypothetical protein